MLSPEQIFQNFMRNNILSPFRELLHVALQRTILLACKTVPGAVFLPTKKFKLRKEGGNPYFNNFKHIYKPVLL